MTLRIVTCAGDPEQEARLASELLDRRDVQLIMRCVDRVELLATVKGGAIDAVVAAGVPVWLDPRSARECADKGVRVVVLASDADEADRALELGLSMLPAAADIGSVVELCNRDLPRPTTDQLRSGPGRIVAIWGPKGAPGRTTVAIEVAAELAASEPNTLLVDADPYGGDIIESLGIVDDIPTIVWAAHLASRDELTDELLFRELRRAFQSGPVVMPGLPSGAAALEVSGFGMRRLVDRCRSIFAFGVFDVGFCLEGGSRQSPTNRNEIALTTIGSADRVVALCAADPIGVKNFVRAWPQLIELVDPSAIVVAANRAIPGEERTIREILRKHLGTSVAIAIPRAASLGVAMAQGRCLREHEPSASLCRAIGELAAILGGAVPARGFLMRLAGRA